MNKREKEQLEARRYLAVGQIKNTIRAIIYLIREIDKTDWEGVDLDTLVKETIVEEVAKL